MKLPAEGRAIHAEIESGEDTVLVDLFYPQINPLRYVEVGICDVRAADSVRLHYDFERDGWVVEQASKFSWDADDDVCDPDWQEVAFVQAWSRERENPDLP